MNFEMFENMTPAEAERFLQEFLHNGKISAVELGIEHTLSLNELPDALGRIADGLEVNPRDPDPAVPAFIRETKEYKDGLFDFAPQSLSAIVGAAFALGDAFIGAFPGLKWATGNREFATANMPVVAGFGKGLELPALLVVENLFSRRIQNPAGDAGFRRAIETWQGHALS